MICDSLMLRRLVVEMGPLVGLRVERVFPVGRAEFALEFRTRQPGGQLALSGHPDAPYLYRTDDREPRAGVETPLAAVLRRHLRGATLIGVSQRAFDRVVEWQFANCEGLGPQARRALVLEISGRHTNLLLLDEDRVILECARHVTARVNRVRQSLPGEPYTPPPAFGKHDPLTLTAEAWADLAPEPSQPAAEWLRAVLQGGSEVFLAVVCDRAGMTPETTLSVADPVAWQRLYEALQAVLQDTVQPGPGYVARSGRNRPVAYPVPLPAPWQAADTYPSLSAACAHLQSQEHSGQADAQRRQRLQSCLTAARDKAQRCEAARAASLAEAEEAESLRHQGELLLAHLGDIPALAAEVALEDWETGAPVTIRLDPALSPQHNAQRYFARYKKQQRVREQVPALLAEARAAREDYEDLLDQVTEGTGEELVLLEEEARQRGLLPPDKKARTPVKADYRRGQTSGGYALLYGRSSLENAAVLKAASPDDWWFHVQGAPGGHVVLRTNNRPQEVPPEALLEAARLAARQSSRRREATVAVDYTLVKHLTRTRGAAPGHVVYRDCRTLLVKPRD